MFPKGRRHATVLESVEEFTSLSLSLSLSLSQHFLKIAFDSSD